MFSEPEVMSVKKFVDSHQNIKFSFDYHSYGNLYVLPSPLSQTLIRGTPYEEFLKEAELGPNNKYIVYINLSDIDLEQVNLCSRTRPAEI